MTNTTIVENEGLISTPVLFRGSYCNLWRPEEPDHVTQKWVSGNFYEAGENGMLTKCHNLKSRYEGYAALDVGAHMGNHSLFFAVVLKMAVAAFEPNPASYSVLQKNAKHLGIRTHNMAIGNHHFARYGVIPGPEGNTGMCRVRVKSDGDVVGTSIDNYLTGVSSQGAIRLIKIDVEGMEQDVLAGARKTIKKHLPDIWVETDHPEKCLELIESFTDRKYEVDGPFNATPTYRFWT